ncbi:MAG: glutamine amidotransferase [Gammaproteobacteria bacterium]|nr:MAG: glutamine amidotransferase [Gammaproteobacteria bacterium]TND04422.1 MAG: glutamine amidotransferase [Gammaproteobacteria bacterium]
MCQLLGMNCNIPTDILFSFEGFCARGGHTDEHSDGWGIAFFEDTGCRLFIDSKASTSSPVAEMVRNYPIRSRNVIAHIRKATIGEVSLVNTHPFMRELWGRYWIFAHNGDLEGELPPLAGRFRPVGSTDSEHAFCLILETLVERFGYTEPDKPQLTRALGEISATLASYGVFNFLLSDGRYLFAHCSTDLYYVVRQAPFSTAHLIDQDVTVDFREVTSPDDRVAVIATKPLTDNEAWTTMTAGQLLVFENGLPQPCHTT